MTSVTESEPDISSDEYVSKYPVLARLTRDILVVLISIVIGCVRRLLVCVVCYMLSDILLSVICYLLTVLLVVCYLSWQKMI
jgi:hypothetical protein